MRITGTPFHRVSPPIVGSAAVCEQHTSATCLCRLLRLRSTLSSEDKPDEKDSNESEGENEDTSAVHTDDPFHLRPIRTHRETCIYDEAIPDRDAHEAVEAHLPGRHVSDAGGESYKGSDP